MFTFGLKWKEYMNEALEQIVVLGNSQGGCIDVDLEDPNECCIILKQGNRRAALIGSIGLLMETNLEAGTVLKNGRIITKEQHEPFVPDDPLFLLKKTADGVVCRKAGKAIYTHSYFTYDKRDYDEIIEPDNV